MNNKRLDSIDALRGFDMFFIMGAASLIVALCKLCPDGAMDWMIDQMSHAKWDGFRHHDTIFPLFLFIAGISFPFSLAKQTGGAETLSQSAKLPVYMKILRRTLILIFLGLVFNGFFKLEWDHLRIFSVLGRIGIAWGIGAVIFMNTKAPARVMICSSILVGYWLILRFIPAPDIPEAYSLSYEGNIVGYIDRCLFPGHLYRETFDPEGLLSTLPAVVTALLGMFAGEIVRLPEALRLKFGRRSFGMNGRNKALLLVCLAVLCLAIGLAWSPWCPVNKKLWSSTFTLLAAAYSFGMFALFYWIIDVKACKGWIMPFKVIGMNSITIYMVQRLFDLRFTNKYIFGGLAGILPEQWSDIVLSAGYLLISWLLMYFLYKQRIFLKV